VTLRDKPWPHGTPNWVELGTTDRRSAWEFYQHVFAWTIEDSGAESGHYGMAMQHGLPVAGLGELPVGSPMRPAWTTYVAADDVDATAAVITANNGLILAPPLDVGEEGRMAIAQDPTGGVFGVWEAGRHIGANVVKEPNTLCWNELLTPEPQRARAFYAAVFGWSFQPVDGSADYSVAHLVDGDEGIGGIGVPDPSLGPGTPAFWLTFFAVPDADRAAGQSNAFGAKVLAGPFDSPYGRMAVITDPQGATFAVLQPAQPEPTET
jgi:predicted enzyme related to lactoylglutathione lyase